MSNTSDLLVVGGVAIALVGALVVYLLSVLWLEWRHEDREIRRIHRAAVRRHTRAGIADDGE